MGEKKGDSWLALIKLFDRNYHFVVLAFISWLVGRYSWHYLYLVLIIIIIHKVEERYREKLVNVAERAKVEVFPPEECVWVNNFLEKILPQVAQFLAETTEAQLRATLQTYLETSKPPSVEDIKVDQISWGTVPPKLTQTRSFNLPEDFQWDFDLDWHSDLRIGIDIKLGGKYLNVPFPIIIENLTLEGRMRLRMNFAEQPPYLDTVTISFISVPLLDIHIRPLKGLDIASMPWVSGWLINTLTEVIKGMLVMPQRLSLHFQEKKDANKLTESQQSENSPEKSQQPTNPPADSITLTESDPTIPKNELLPKNSSTDSMQSLTDSDKSIDSPEKKSRADSIGKLTRKLSLSKIKGEEKTESDSDDSSAKKRRPSLSRKLSSISHKKHTEYDCMLCVNLMEGKDLLAMDSNGLSDPYVIFTVGKKEQRSRTIKDTLNPKWNQTISLMIEKSDPKLLKIKVKDWNAISSHSTIGIAEVDFTNIAMNSPKEMTLTLLSKEGKQDKARGSIKFSITKFDAE